MSGALLVAGTTSDAGKSVLVAGLCRWLSREGVSVAPFKAQNMSLNSFVTRGGAEIGRAQAMQAAAAGVEPDARMNPVLLKPGANGTQVVLLGQPDGEIGALDYAGRKAALARVAQDCLASLRREYDVVICEGAGSPAEINLRAADIANMGLARAAGLPVLVVTDIDRGGAFAALYGTVALLEPADQALIAGFVINKFRGDRALLDPGLDMITGLTGRAVLGVLPWAPGLWLDAEDSLALDHPRPAAGPPHGGDVLRVSVVRVPRISNFTDIDALAAEPGVLVRMASTPAELADADLVVLPGSRATVADLAWLRERGFEPALAERARAGRPLLGICGGYQQLATRITDEVESGAGTVAGLGLLPVTVEFAAGKTLARPELPADASPLTGYEIHHAITTVTGDAAQPFLDGCRVGAVWGTSWHGALENDEFRRGFLTEVAASAGRDFQPAPDTCFRDLRQDQLDLLGDLVADHLDTRAVRELIHAGAPAGLPVLPPAGAAISSRSPAR